MNARLFRSVSLGLSLIASAAMMPPTAAQCHWTQQGYLEADDAAAGDGLGPVALQDDTLVVGAVYGDGAASDSGSAYVFVRGGHVWAQQQELCASDGAAGDAFGGRVAIWGDTAVVGAAEDDHGGRVDAGSAYVFTRSGTVWAQQQKLVASDAAADDFFGSAVALFGDTIVVGAVGDDHAAGVDAGSAYVFTRSGTVWTQGPKLVASDAAGGDDFGSSVALDGTSAVVGAPLNHHPGTLDRGAAYVFDAASGAQLAKLTASDAQDGDYFGWPVAISGSTVVVGAPEEDRLGLDDAGAAYVFVGAGTSWSEQAKLVASDAASLDGFGEFVACWGDKATVSSKAGAGAGAVYLYSRRGTTWTECQELTSCLPSAGDELAFVSIWDDTLAAGAVSDDTPAGVDAGSVHVFGATLGEPHCTATPNSSGCPASITALGETSVSANDLTLIATPVPDQPFIFFFGPNRIQVPFGNGFLCAGGGLTRILPPGAALGGGALRAVDLPSVGLLPGPHSFQCWFRDPAGGGAAFNTSDAVEVILVP